MPVPAMQPQNAIDFADRISRRRMIGSATAALVFLGVQVVARPVFLPEGQVTGPRSYMWAINAGILLLLLLPIGGFIFGGRIRALVNDEVSRSNSRTAAASSFWLAMAIALLVHALPSSATLSAREATYLIVTPVSILAPLLFAWLEFRAHRDG
jgi:hypothetical protein